MRSVLSASSSPVQTVIHRLRAEGRAVLLRNGLQVVPRSDLVAVGDLSYGGYRVPIGMLDADSVVYAVGVGEDIRFDLDLIARVGCTIHAMDPVPRAAQHAQTAAGHEPRFIFHQLALWSRDETLTFHAPAHEGHISHSAVNLSNTQVAFQAQGRALRSLMDSWGHDHIDLLKVSAEGAEFEILETLLRDGPVVPILCAEFSLPPLSRARTMAGRLTANGYQLVDANVKASAWTFTWLHDAPAPATAGQP